MHSRNKYACEEVRKPPKVGARNILSVVCVSLGDFPGPIWAESASMPIDETERLWVSLFGSL
jgi:hypothetical protein